MTTDAGNFAGWATRFLNFSEGQRYIGPTNGAMGYSVPAGGRRQDRLPRSHGRQHGRRWRLHDDRTGDRHRLPSWRCADRAGVQQPDVRHDPHASGKRLSLAGLRHRLTNPDFGKYIEAFGGHGEVVSATDEFAPAFRRAVESGRPALIELRTNPGANHHACDDHRLAGRPQAFDSDGQDYAGRQTNSSSRLAGQEARLNEAADIIREEDRLSTDLRLAQTA